jgi:hypothetical protein
MDPSMAYVILKNSIFFLRISFFSKTFSLFTTEDGPKKGEVELLHYRIELNKNKELLINGRKCTLEGLLKAAYVDDGIAPLQKVCLKILFYKH